MHLSPVKFHSLFSYFPSIINVTRRITHPSGEYPHEILIVFSYAGVVITQFNDFLARMQHRCVIPAAKRIANFGQTVVLSVL